MQGVLKPGSSPVDWCESNYHISPLIAEFVNTVSNLVFLLFPPLLMQLSHQYGCRVTKGIHLVWALMIVVGLSSAYFHATLSLVGQLLDELAILWTMVAAFGLWFPKHLLPRIFRDGNRNRFRWCLVIVASVLSVLACFHPIVNAFALMLVTLPMVGILIWELRTCQDRRAFSLGLRAGLIFFIGLGCWISDRLYCSWWESVNFPYLHGIWHIFGFISAYTGCVLFAYFDVAGSMPESGPVIRYWPVDNFELGVPYVKLETIDSQKISKLL